MARSDDFDFYCEEAISGHTPINKVYESESVLAFYHTKPLYEKHIVVVPKKHIHDLASVEDSDLPTLNEMIKVCRDIAKDCGYEKTGAKVITNLGIFQDTPHLHFHVIAGQKIR